MALISEVDVKRLSLRAWPRFYLGLWVACAGMALATVETRAASRGHGFSYQHDEVRDKPWSIHIIKIDRSSAGWELHSALGKGAQIGLGTLSQQIGALPADIGRPVAGINGDYYHKDRPYVGDPKGLQIMRGELVSGPCDWTCFWLDTNGYPHMTNVMSHFRVTWPNGAKTPFGLNEERQSDTAVIYTSVIGASTRTSGGRELVLERNGSEPWLPLKPGEIYSARVREVREAGNTPVTSDTMVLSLGRQVAGRVPKVTAGSLLKVSTQTSPDLKGTTIAIGGGPLIVRGGKAVGEHERIRHPRSAIGWNKDSIFLVEVDGRQRFLSVGMAFWELADYMIKLGCEEAMGLDGGGSATCWVQGQVMSSPSEGRERAMANSLVLVLKDRK